jgi:3-hydroxyacyl-[acyl-carrier-protein] dehydratase
MKKIELDKKKIEEYQQNRDPYLMIDYATEVIPGVSSKGYKKLTEDEWFFKVHWPSDPNMPGMLQIEALVQMSSLAILTLPTNKNKILYLVNATNLKFKKKIIPNDKLEMKTKILSFKRGIANCKGDGYVNNDLACSAEFTLILPDKIKSYIKKI